MSRLKALFLIGLIVAALPFLGFPQAWDTAGFVAAGALIMVLALSLRWDQHDTLPVAEEIQETYDSQKTAEHDPETVVIARQQAQIHESYHRTARDVPPLNGAPAIPQATLVIDDEEHGT